MDGYTALQYARLRSVDNDWVRIQRQRTVIQAVLDQIKTATPLELDSLLNAVLPLVQTNFTRSEIAALLVQLPGFLGVTAEQMSLPAEGTYGSRTGMDGRQMYDPDWAENVAILHDFLYGEDSDSDAYAHEEEVETSLNDYTDDQLADMADYMAANSMAADLADGTGLWPGEAELAAAAADAATGEDAQQAEPAQAADGAAAADGQQVWLAGFDTAADSLAVYQSMVQHLHETEGVNTLLTKTGPGKQGAQLRMGIHFALKRGYQGVLTVDGNNKDSIEDVPKFIAKLKEGYDLVQGSRFVKGGHAVNTPRSRYLAVRLIHAPIISLAAKQWFTDTTNAYRAYSREYLTTPTKISGFKGNSELLKVLLATLAGKYNP